VRLPLSLEIAPQIISSLRGHFDDDPVARCALQPGPGLLEIGRNVDVRRSLSIV
jgi:hypothetical protein